MDNEKLYIFYIICEISRSPNNIRYDFLANCEY